MTQWTPEARLDLIKSQIAEKTNHEYVSGDLLNRHHTNKIRIKHLACGTVFDVTIGNFIRSKNPNYCPTCGAKERTRAATQSIVDRCDDRDEYLMKTYGFTKEQYGKLVRRYTAKTYRQYSREINPMGLRIAPAGVEGAYHVDHIVSIGASCDLEVPIHPKILACKYNLVMMDALDNITKGKSVQNVGLLQLFQSATKRMNSGESFSKVMKFMESVMEMKL